MKFAAQRSVKEGDVIIFLVDEYRQGKKEVFDGHVQIVSPEGVDVLYLSGYKSRNDFIEWKDVVAKVDLNKPYVQLEGHPFRGHFEVFKGEK